MKYPRFWKVTAVYIHKHRTSNICWIHSRVTCLCGILLIYIPIHKEGLPFQFCTFGNYFKYYVGLSSGQELPSEEVSKYWTLVFYWQQWQQFSSSYFLTYCRIKLRKKIIVHPKIILSRKDKKVSKSTSKEGVKRMFKCFNVKGNEYPPPVCWNSFSILPKTNSHKYIGIF